MYNVWVAGNAQSLFGEAFSVAANPSLVFWFLDNHFWNPRSAGSWLWNGTVYTPSSQSSTTYPAVQKGHAAIVTALRALNPNILIMANSDYFSQVYNGTTPSKIDPSTAGLYNAVFCEQVIGQSNSLQNVATFGQLLGALISAEQQVATNGTLIFHQAGRLGGANYTATNGTQSNWTSTDWASVLFGFGMSMLRNYHYNMTAGPNYQAQDMLYFDTFNGGGSKYGWLQNPVDVPQSVAQFPNGIFGRRYQGGIVVVNPYGNGTQPVALPATYWTPPYAGRSDPTVNTNAQVSSLSMAAGTAAVLSNTQL
jgi:hypothetical protein